jgi:hypothetical protein
MGMLKAHRVKSGSRLSTFMAENQDVKDPNCPRLDSRRDHVAPVTLEPRILMQVGRRRGEDEHF